MKLTRLSNQVQNAFDINNEEGAMVAAALKFAIESAEFEQDFGRKGVTWLKSAVHEIEHHRAE